MKKTWKLAFAAFALFAFTACGNQDTATEAETVDTTTEMETTEMEDELETEMGRDTTVLEDTTVNDGVADEIQEEQPPQQ